MKRTPVIPGGVSCREAGGLAIPDEEIPFITTDSSTFHAAVKDDKVLKHSLLLYSDLLLELVARVVFRFRPHPQTPS